MFDHLLNFPAKPHQVYGARYALKHHYSINAYKMGCVSGDTVLRVNRGGIGRKYTIKDVYEKLNGLSKRNWDSTIPTKLRCMKGDLLGLHLLDTVVQSGVKDLYRLQTEDSYIDLTKDHKIFTKAGWKRAGEVTVEDYIALDRATKHQKGQDKIHWTKVEKSLEYIGREMTYDVIMTDPYRNFIANNLVVHNSGKSLLGIILMLYTGLPTVIVCPAYLKYNWEEEILKFSKVKLKIKLLLGRDQGFKPTNEDVVILNYTIASRFPEVFMWGKFLLCDECHLLGNPLAGRTKFIMQMLKRNPPERVLFLSGSPITGKIPQWYSLLYMMGLNRKETSGKIVEKGYTRFREKFCNTQRIRIGGGREITQYVGGKNLHELRTFLKGKFLRKDPNFVLELPPTFEKIVFASKKKFNKELEEEFLEGREVKDEAISSAKKSSAISKVAFTAKYVTNILEETAKPVVIYSDHVFPVEELSSLLGKRFRVCSITGSTPLEERHKYVKGFQDGNYDFFIATIGAASTGITLTKATNLVFNDLSWVHDYNEQAKKRIHRIGQEHSCTFHIVFSSKIDAMIARKVKEKKEITDLTTNFKEGDEWREL